MPPTPRIAAWGGLMIGAKSVTPIIPKFEMVKEPPLYSTSFSLPFFRASGEVLYLYGNLPDIFIIGETDDGCKKPLFDRNGHGDIDALIENQGSLCRIKSAID